MHFDGAFKSWTIPDGNCKVGNEFLFTFMLIWDKSWSMLGFWLKVGRFATFILFCFVNMADL